METNHLKLCHSFLSELDDELSSRIAGLETAVEECSSLLHKLNRCRGSATQQAAEGVSVAIPPPPPPAHAAPVMVGGGDEIDSILHKAKSTRLRDKPRAIPSNSNLRPSKPASRLARDKLEGRPEAGTRSREDELDKILRLARGMRRADDTALSDGAAMAAEPAPPNTAPTLQMEVPPPPLMKVDGHRIEKLVAHLWTPDRAATAAQTQSLSAGAACAMFPRSAAFLSVRSALSQTAVPAPPTAAATEPTARLLDDRGDCYTGLAAMLRENRMKYTKHMKRLLRVGEKISQIGPADREELFKHWYAHHALLELYGVLRQDRLAMAGDGGGTVAREDISASCLPIEMRAARDNVRALPKATPLDFGASVPKFLDPSWLSSSLRETELFNEALKTRTKFAAETVIARTALRECIQLLRQCTLRSRDGGCDFDQWVAALRLYRSVWSCLTNGDSKQEAGNVSFVFK